jgi:hypothetical protein
MTIFDLEQYKQQCFDQLAEKFANHQRIIWILILFQMFIKPNGCKIFLKVPLGPFLD